MLDIAPLEPSILTNELSPIESALRKNNGWLLPPAVPFLPDPDGEMASLDDSSGEGVEGGAGSGCLGTNVGMLARFDRYLFCPSAYWNSASPLLASARMRAHLASGSTDCSRWVRVSEDASSRNARYSARTSHCFKIPIHPRHPSKKYHQRCIRLS